MASCSSFGSVVPRSAADSEQLFVAGNTWSIAPRGHGLAVIAFLQAQTLETNQTMEDKFWKKLSQVVFELWGDCLVGIAGKSQYFKVCQRPWKNCFNGHPFPTVALYVISIQYTIVESRKTVVPWRFNEEDCKRISSSAHVCLPGQWNVQNWRIRAFLFVFFLAMLNFREPKSFSH